MESTTHTSRQLWAVATEHARRHQQERERRLSLAARIAALQKEEEDALLQEEENLMIAEQNEKAAKRQLFAEQQDERQQTFRSSITDHVVRGVREAADTDPMLKDAVDTIANDRDGNGAYQVLHAALLSELASSGQGFIKDLARRMLNHSSVEDDRILNEFATGTQDATTENDRPVTYDKIAGTGPLLLQSQSQMDDANTTTLIICTDTVGAPDPVLSDSSTVALTTQSCLTTSDQTSAPSSSNPALLAINQPTASGVALIKSEMTQLPALDSIERPISLDIEDPKDIGIRSDSEKANAQLTSMPPDDLDDDESAGARGRPTSPLFFAENLEVKKGSKKRTRNESINSTISVESATPGSKKPRKKGATCKYSLD
jgi:hypothetical protein